MVRALGGSARFLASWLLVVAGAFLALRLMPGDPVARLVAEMGVRPSAEVIAGYREAFGLEGSLAAQFLAWLAGFVTLDWGVSPVTGRAILPDLAARAPWSLAIGIGGLGLATCLGFALGFRAAARPGGIAEATSRALAVAGQALPAFAVGLVLLWLVAVEWRLIRPFSGPPHERLLLPILLVCAFSIGSVARLSRAAFAEVSRAPYLATARMKGLSPRAALWRHGRRHAALTVLAATLPEMAWVIGGTAIAEIVFGVPGISERVLSAVHAREYGVLQAYVALVALWLLACAGAAGALRRRLDPRVAS